MTFGTALVCPHYHINRQILGKKMLLKLNVYFLQKSVSIIPPSNNNSARYYHKRTQISYGVSLDIANLSETRNLSKDFYKFKIRNMMKIGPVEAEFLRANAHTDMTMLTNTFSNFTNWPKNECYSISSHLTTLYMDRYSTEFTFYT